MAMLHLRVVCPKDDVSRVVSALTEQVGVVAVREAGETTHGWEVCADLARESAEKVLDALHGLDVCDEGMITLVPLDTAIGALADRAEQDAPGDGADVVIWDELAERTGEDSQLTGTFLAFMVLATLLAAVGVVTDSQVTVVGAMVVGPEFGPLAGLAVGIMRRRAGIVRRAALALVVGFPVAIIAVAVLALLARGVGLISPSDIAGGHRQTEFIYSPGWFSLITAVVAGCAGMLSLTSSKSAALVGVFISVTTIPAAGNAAVGAVLGQSTETYKSLAQLAINLVGISAAGLATLVVMRHFSDRVTKRAAH